ncbi:CHAT domain protein [Ceratobasidium sp. AG-Ba]|nr:CHAT domain protein [Ceratobasidium sp. AG-Ba]
MEQSISPLEFGPDHDNSGLSAPSDVPLVQQKIPASHDSQEPEVESEDLKQFKTLVLLLRYDRKTDGELVDRKMLEAASILRGRNAIVVLAREALNDLNENLKNPISEPAFLYYLAGGCVTQYNRLHCIELVEIAIECYEHGLFLEDGSPEDNFETLAVLGNLNWNCFDKLRNPAYLDIAIEYLEKAVEKAPLEHSTRLDIFRDLGLSYRDRFDVTHEIRDIDLAIAYHAQAVTLSPDKSDPSTLTHIGHLGNSHLRRFEYLGEVRDLNNAIACHSEASSLTPDGESYKYGTLHNLGSSYCSRFQLLGQADDMDLAISCYIQAVALAPDDEPQKYKMLLGLATAHKARFDRLGERTDLDQELECSSKALLVVPHGYFGRPKVLVALGDSYLRRFEILKDHVDLDQAVASVSEAIDSTATTDPDYPSVQNKLVNLYRTRFDNTGDIADLERALKLGRDINLLRPHHNTHQHDALQGLALSYGDRYERLGELKDLDLAIEYTREGLSRLPMENPSRVGWLSNLGSLYGSRLDRLGAIEDLDMATQCCDEAVAMMTEDHPDKPLVTLGLGNLYSRRFARIGELLDIDKAVAYYSEAVFTLPDSHLAKATAVANLGQAYRSRFQYLGLLPDNDKSISYFSQAVSLGSDGHPEKRSWHLYYLGVAYCDRFGSSQNRADLDLGIEYYTRAIACIPDDHARKPERMGGLGSAYIIRFEKFKEISDLEYGIELLRQGLLLMPIGHLRRPTLLDHLGSAYNIRFRHLGELSDSEQSVSCLTESVSLIPHGHPRRPMLLGNLGHSYLARFRRVHDEKDRSLAIECYMQAGRSSSGQPLIKFQLFLQWARMLFITDSPSVFDAYDELMRLVPHTIWLGGTIEQRYEQIMEIGSVGLEAASAAALFNKFELAIEWLEQGRSIVWNQLLGLRTPLDGLMAIDPSLGREIHHTAQRMQGLLTQDLDRMESSISCDDSELIAQEHRRLAHRWEQLVQRAQSLPELQEFLRPKKAQELLSACESSTVVVVIVHKFSCQALVLGGDNTPSGHLILGGLKYKEILATQVQFSNLVRMGGGETRGFCTAAPSNSRFLEKTLKVLWDEVAKPVLDLLGYTDKLPLAQLPHITWCLTGPLASLPLHAAGDYKGTGLKLSDYAVSSYTPNLASLLVPQAEPKNFSVAELDNISALEGDGMAITRLEGDRATASTVLDAMERHSWVHLACHASQDIKRPIASAFYLHDGPLDLATVTGRKLQNADLAFLSACQTATGDHQLPEEAVHLAAGMLMAGYRRVIATMWSINDNDAPRVAERFYAYMLDEEQPSANKAARAIHYATNCLRTDFGVQDITRWAPYIHIGL